MPCIFALMLFDSYFMKLYIFLCFLFEIFLFCCFFFFTALHGTLDLPGRQTAPHSRQAARAFYWAQFRAYFQMRGSVNPKLRPHNLLSRCFQMPTAPPGFSCFMLKIFAIFSFVILFYILSFFIFLSSSCRPIARPR